MQDNSEPDPEKANHLDVTVRAPAGASDPFSFKDNSRVDKATGEAVDHFVAKRELADPTINGPSSFELSSMAPISTSGSCESPSRFHPTARWTDFANNHGTDPKWRVWLAEAVRDSF
ncbi:MAG: hypothetical protein QOI95_3087 [Acidimicrobiaceae bacterium]|jgi:hypothetical protein